MEEDWDLLVSFFPEDWRELASARGALKGLRQDKDPGKLLRTLLLHTGCGLSLRETVVRARRSGLADLSDVALLKRLRKCEHWLQGLCHGLFAELGIASSSSITGTDREVRLIDASTIKEPGKTGSLWKLHYSLRWPGLRCDYLEITPSKGEGNGESFTRFRAVPGEHLVGDRGYSSARGIHAIASAGADVTVRLNAQNVHLLDSRGAPFDLPQALREVKAVHQCASWEALIADHRDEHEVRGRLCVLRKDEAAIRLAKEKIRRQASKKQTTVNELTWLYAEYVMVFTTVGEDRMDAKDVLDFYRVRWQVELAFKRLKQLAGLGHLPKTDEASSRSWLYGKLFSVLLTEKLIAHAERFSPWGYPLQGNAENSQSVA